MKDNFSENAAAYNKYRPRYPKAFFEFILSMTEGRERAWDCGTGNGQVAGILADHFQEIIATDISGNQLYNAVKKDNITYRQEQAESTSAPDNYYNLITVAQAIHWFDFGRFYSEVNRTLKQDGVLVVVGYSLFRIRDEIDALTDKFYYNTIGAYWDNERRFIDEKYKTIPFPFNELPTPDFTMEYNWTLEELVGYLRTWSAVKHYISKNQTDPVVALEQEYKALWHDDSRKKVSFPLMLRIGHKY